MKRIPFLALLAACLCAGAQSSQAQAFVGLQTNGTSLSSYSSPGAAPVTYTVTGLGTDTLVDIDYFTSSGGALYGMSSTGTLYSLAVTSATTYAATAASNVGAIPGGVAAIDFNPSANRLRVFASTATSGSNNYRITPGVGGAITPDGMLTYTSTDTSNGITPNLIGAAYTNNNPGAASTSLYSIDRATNSLVLHTGTPAFSTLTTVATLTLGGLTFTPTANTGFDITSINGVNIAYLSSNTSLYTVNLGTGVMILAANLSGAAITDIAFVPEPGTYAMIALGSLGLTVWVLRCRRQTDVGVV